MMELSELIKPYKSKGFNVVTKQNLRKYFLKYPHAIRIKYYGNDWKYHKQSSLYHVSNQVYDRIIKKYDDFRLRKDFDSINIFCNDLKKVMKLIDMNVIQTLSNNFEIIVEYMPADVKNECNSIHPDLPRATTSVVKKLPHGLYRYKIFWTNSHYLLQKIGKNSVEAIIDQIINDSGCLLSDTNKSYLIRLSCWGNRYFYATDENILNIIALIDPRFIYRIEKYKTLEEIKNEVKVS